MHLLGPNQLTHHTLGAMADKYGPSFSIKLGNMTHNSIIAMVAGKRYYGSSGNAKHGEAQKFEKITRKFIQLFMVFSFSDYIPFLKWLDSRAHKREMKRTAQEMDIFIQGWLEEHKQKRLLRGEGPEGDEDFMDVMLTILKDAEIAGFDADTINKATSLSLILGGRDTTTVVLIWAVCLLLNNRDVLQNAQAELEKIVGKDRLVDESDIKNLVYLQAIVKETLRLYAPGPVIPLPAATEDCIINPGYHIPAGTRVMVNVWKIHRDESVWPEPNIK